MTITSRYNGKCTACGGFIARGEQVDWTKGTKGVRHPGSCPATPAAKPQTVRISEGDDFDRAKAWLEALPTPTEFEQSLLSQLSRGLTERQIEVCINAIDKAVKKAEAGSQQEVPEGIVVGVYETDEGIFIVKPTKDKKRLYAKRLVEITAERATEAGERVQIEFEYDKSAIYKLRPEHKMDVERAKALTIRYGRCIVCGIKLKAAESVERGIGPVCIKSFAVKAGV